MRTLAPNGLLRNKSFISVFIYFGLIRDRYSNAGVTIQLHLRRDLYFFGGMGIGAVIILVLVFGGLYLLLWKHAKHPYMQ